MLLTKTMPVWKRHICIGHGFSKNWHGGIDDKMAGTGQGNRFSGHLCTDTSCLTIKHVEECNTYLILLRIHKIMNHRIIILYIKICIISLFI